MIAAGAFTLVNQPAPAQQHELGLTLGRLTGIDRNSPRGDLRFGSGVALQANYGYRFARTSGLSILGEVHFLANPQRKITSPNTDATRDAASLYVTPGIRVKLLPSSPVSPHFSFGAGYALYEQSLTRIDGEPNDAPRHTHRGTLAFGAGVDFKVWRFIGGRVEVRDFYSGNPSFNAPLSGSGQHNLVAGGGFVLKFGGSED